jgi:hypothetical protein
MSDIPKLGSKTQLSPNDTTTQQTGRNGLVTFYPFGDDQSRPAVISINGDNGGVDIGGTREKHGKLLLRDKFMTITYIIDGETGTTSQSGDICLFDQNGNERVCISGKTANITIKSAAGHLIAHLDGKVGDLTLGGQGQDGDLIVRDAAARETIRLDGSQADALLGGNGRSGDVRVRNAAGDETIRLNGSSGDAVLGGNGQDGDVVVRNSAGGETIRLDGSSGDAVLGGNGQDGDVVVRNSAGGETIRLDGGTGDAVLGGNGQDGDVVVRNSAGGETIRLDGETADLSLGGSAQDGDVRVRNAASATTIHLDGDGGNLTADGMITSQDLIVNGAATIQDLTVNGATVTRDIAVRNTVGVTTIEVDGDAGDIRMLGADLAEDFDVLDAEDIAPGTVVVLDQEGRLRQCAQAYDKKVAGIISGAGSYRPGIVLDNQRSRSNRLPVALMGKVYCKADADYAPIEVGDVLTTAPTPGHAMKATDPHKAFGAVIGKALRPLGKGQGLIPVLVSLQ